MSEIRASETAAVRRRPAAAIVRRAALALVAFGLAAGPARGAVRPASGLGDLGQEYPPIQRVEFADTDIRDICKIVSDTTGLSIFVSPAVKERVGVWGRDIGPIELLEKAVDAAGVTYVMEGATISVMSWDEYQQRYGLTKEVIPLRHIRAEDALDALTPFLTKRGKALGGPLKTTVVIYETPGALEELRAVLRAIDVEGAAAALRVIKLEHASAAAVAANIEKLKEPGPEGARQVIAYADARTNQIVLSAPPDRIAGLEELVRGLDVELPEVVRNYQVVFLDAEEVHQNLRQHLGLGDGADGGQRARRNVTTTLGEQSNSIVVSGSEADHARVRAFLKEVDVPIRQIPSGIKVYRLQNASPENVAGVITEVLAGGGESGYTPAQPGVGGGGDRGATERSRTPRGGGERTPGRTGSAADDARGGGVADRPTVSIDEEANAVVVRATAQQHEELRRLIEDLDKPRPQVLIEAIIVQIASDDDFELGVELGASNFGGRIDTGYIAFTSFGLSTYDPETRTREIVGRGGLNAAIVRPDDIPLIINALESANNVRVYSAPKILVNNNAEGVIDSLQEEPFTEINTGETVSTTTFGGYASAGTVFTVVPHVSEPNTVRLEYSLMLNTFTDDPPEPGVPPPRATDSIESQAVVPDGHTIIVGGLRSSNEREGVRRLPILGRIPILGYLFGTRSTSETHVTVYVFIRPLIVRAREFESLKHISVTSAQAAGVEPDFPTSDVRPIGR